VDTCATDPRWGGDAFNDADMEARIVLRRRLEAGVRDRCRPFRDRVHDLAELRRLLHNYAAFRAVGIEHVTPTQEAAAWRLDRQLQRAGRPKRVLIAQPVRIRRGHCGPRRRPRARRVVSRSAGGGSSGDPDDGEPSEAARRAAGDHVVRDRCARHPPRLGAIA
jgi:hypothetical protein